MATVDPATVGLIVGPVVFVVLVVLLRVDWSPGSYKVIYHRGQSVDLSTRVASGRLTIEAGSIRIRGEQDLAIPLGGLRSVEIFRLHGLGRMIRLDHDQGPFVVSVVRFCIAGQFASVDFFKTGKLATVLSAEISARVT